MNSLQKISDLDSRFQDEKNITLKVDDATCRKARIRAFNIEDDKYHLRETTGAKGVELNQAQFSGF